MGSVWLQSSVASLSRALSCCVDRNTFPESFKCELRHCCSTEAQVTLLCGPSSSRWWTWLHGRSWPICARGVVPHVVNWLTFHCPSPQATEGQVERASLLRSAHSGLVLGSGFTRACLFFPQHLPERRTLTFNAALSASFHLPWVVLIRRLQLFIRFIKCSSCQGLWAHEQESKH